MKARQTERHISKLFWSFCGIHRQYAKCGITGLILLFHIVCIFILLYSQPWEMHYLLLTPPCLCIRKCRNTQSDSNRGAFDEVRCHGNQAGSYECSEHVSLSGSYKDSSQGDPQEPLCTRVRIQSSHDTSQQQSEIYFLCPTSCW